MERSARHRRTWALWPVAVAGLVSVGCVAGTAGFEAGPVPELCEGREILLPAALEPPHLAAAGQGVSGPKKGPGLSAAIQWTVFSDWRTKATDAIPTGPGGTIVPSPGQYMYRDLYDDGYGFSFSWIMRRPATGTISVGDTYLLGRFDVQRFAGKTWTDGTSTTEFDGFEHYRVWLEAKTMFKPVGRSLRPYVRYAGGFVQTTEVGADADGTPSGVWDPTLTAGFSGGFGLDIRLGLWFFVDIGVEVIGAPKMAGEEGVGRAEPMVATPLRLGLMFNF